MNLLMPLAGFTAWAATHCPSEDLNLLPKRLCGDGHGANVHLSNGFQRDSDTAGKRWKLRHVQPEHDGQHTHAASECLPFLRLKKYQIL